MRRDGGVSSVGSHSVAGGSGGGCVAGLPDAAQDDRGGASKMMSNVSNNPWVYAILGGVSVALGVALFSFSALPLPHAAAVSAGVFGVAVVCVAFAA